MGMYSVQTADPDDLTALRTAATTHHRPLATE